MKHFLLSIFGYLLIYIAVDVGRPQEYQAAMFSTNWFIQVALITVGGIILGIPE